MKIQAGWAVNYDKQGRPQVKEYDAISDALLDYPEVFGDAPFPITSTFRDFINQVDLVNSEGNYHEFIFRIVELS